MALETSNTSAVARTQSTLRRRIDDVEEGSRRISKRWKRVPNDDDEYAAASCLISLARSGGAAATTTAGYLDVKSAEKNSYYKCGVCSKTFPSYQALGGHKTSHRNKPPTAVAASNFSGTAETSSCSVDPNPCPISRLHKCTICHKNFLTGQALGGHKRKHYVGRRKGGAKSSGANCSEDGSGASGVTSTDAGAVSHSQGGGADALAFDLNLSPPPELDLTLTFM